MAKSRQHKAIVSHAESESAKGAVRLPESVSNRVSKQKTSDDIAGKGIEVTEVYYRSQVTERLADVLSSALKDAVRYDSAAVLLVEPATTEIIDVLHLATNEVLLLLVENPLTGNRIDERVVKSGLVQQSTTTIETIKDGVTGTMTMQQVVVPLWNSERVIGVLEVQADRNSTYSTAEVAALTTVAEQLVRTFKFISTAAVATGWNRLAKLAAIVVRLFPVMREGKERFTHERAVLEEAVRTLSLGLQTNRHNAEWLLEHLPEECRTIATAFQQSGEPFSASSSQDAALVGNRRTAGLGSENEQKAAAETKVKRLGGPSQREDASLPQNSLDEAVLELSYKEFFAWFDERLSSSPRHYLQQSLTQFAHAQMGKNFGTGEVNSQFAKGLHSRMKEVGIFVACPGTSGVACGDASYFRCKPRHPSYPTGVFYFEHADQEQATHGWSESVPELNFLGPDRKPLTFA